MALAAPAPHQLALPLGLPAVAAARPRDEWWLPPQAVWASLSPPLQTRVYQTVLRIAAEVVGDANRT